MIIWIASYPKSGNTWVRLFIENLFYSKNQSSRFNGLIKINQYPLKNHFSNLVNNLTDINEIKKYWITSQEIINLDKKIKLFKTHNAYCSIDGYPFTNNDNTYGVIHVVRDPRSVITSIKNYFSKNNYEESKEFIFDDKRIIFHNYKKALENYPLTTAIGSWGGHYRSWKYVKKNYLLVKYEQLIKDPNKEFQKISDYLSHIYNIKFTSAEINQSIESCSFEKLKNDEEKFGFQENLSENKKFFYLGPKNQWHLILNKKLANEIKIRFTKEMDELNYI